MDTLPYIVTGANAGIGKAIAAKLAGMGRRVVMVSRDAEKGRVAADEVRAAAKGMRGGAVELVVGSLNTVADARRLGRDDPGPVPENRLPHQQRRGLDDQKGPHRRRDRDDLHGQPPGAVYPDKPPASEP